MNAYQSGAERLNPVDGGVTTVANTVSWSAIFVGAIGAAALSLILLILGTGLGLSSVSPWAFQGVGMQGFGVSAIVWITLTQLLASGMGGYLAGRLRTRWNSVHSDEVYFRDTVHGFMTWAVATLVTAGVLASITGAIVSGGVQASATVVGAATAGATGIAGAAIDKSSAGSADSGGYFIDSLFRKNVSPGSPTMADPLPATEATSTAATTAEISRIILNNMGSTTLPADDVRYVGQAVAQRTGLSQNDAEKRVSDTYARMQTKLVEAQTAARAAADKARKASAYAALWIFISLLIGAFVASYAATLGSRQRDV